MMLKAGFPIAQVHSSLPRQDKGISTLPRNARVHASAGARASNRQKFSAPSEVKIITVEPDGSDAWRLSAVADMIREGKVGIIPTDTLPAIVCDLENRDAVLKLYGVKDLDPKKPLSILCHSLKEIAHYTAGFPVSNEAGQPNWFNVCRKILPGPYTLILPATKNLPGQCVDFMKGKTIHRKAVGVRMPANAVAQAILEDVGRPLLCTSVHVPEQMDEHTEVPDVGSMLELYSGKGIDFVVDIGRHIATCSTVVDMTGRQPEVLRYGKGDASMFEE